MVFWNKLNTVTDQVFVEMGGLTLSKSSWRDTGSYQIVIATGANWLIKNDGALTEKRHG